MSAGPAPGGSPAASGGPVALAILMGGLVGAVLLLAAELTTLYRIGSPSGAVVRSYGTGAHHNYAMGLIAVLVAFLALGVWRTHSRSALLAIGVLSVIALLIALLGDLPDAQATGLLRAGPAGYVSAGAHPSTGLYLETLGAVVLLITSVGGFVLAGPSPRRRGGA